MQIKAFYSKIYLIFLEFIRISLIIIIRSRYLTCLTKKKIY